MLFGSHEWNRHSSPQTAAGLAEDLRQFVTPQNSATRHFFEKCDSVPVLLRNNTFTGSLLARMMADSIRGHECYSHFCSCCFFPRTLTPHRSTMHPITAGHPTTAGYPNTAGKR